MSLTKLGGRRRFNVAITRAKNKFVLVASIKAMDFDSKNEEVMLIKEYFSYVEKGGEKLENQSDRDPLNSNFRFEEDIYEVLTQKGYKVKKRVGRSAFPIDLAVIDHRNSNQEEFILGIVCDGTIYNRFDTVRDCDRLRIQILERLGWKIYRVWSIEWFHDRNNQIELLVHHIESLLNQQ